MSASHPEKMPKTQPASAGGPPRPPKKTARGLSDPAPEGRPIQIPDRVVLKELASALRQRPFRIVADLLERGQFKSTGDTVDFETAAAVARKYGFHAQPAA